MSPHSDSTSSGEPAQVRVLYAEDNADDVDLTRRYFAMHAPDIWLDVVRTAAACVEELARHRHDALLLDYRLPDLDGVDVLRALAAKGWRIPVVVTTAAGDEELAVRLLRLGAADYVPKESDYLRLLPAAIRQAVNDQRTRDARGLEIPPALRRVLYVEQHPADIDLTIQRLTEALPSVRIEVMRTAMEALARVRAGGVDLVLADLRMPDMSAVDLLREMRYSGLCVPLIVITGRGDETAAVAAIKLGAYDYIVKRDGYLTHLPYVIEHAMTRHQLTEVNDRLRRELAERARLQEATDESFALLDTLQKHAPIGIAFMDREFRYQQVNDELAAINGVPVSAHLGRTVAEVVPEIWTQVEPLCRRALTGETARAEVAGAADDVRGERRFVAHHYPVRRETGRIIGIGVAVAEVTDQKRAEAVLREQAVALAEASQHKDEFLAMLSHELRNPLAPVRTALDLLRRTEPAEGMTRRALGVMDRQLGHLVRLTDDLLEVARITTGRITVNPSPVDLRTIVHDALESVDDLIQARHHTLHVSSPPDPIVIEGDATRLTQVIVNLVNNAAKYTDPGGTIEVHVGAEEGSGVVRVTDTGAGISARLLPKVFDLFTQDDRTLDRALGGLGLGLTVVRRITELHGGTVRARSEGVGRGSEFTVRLPLSTARLAAPGPPATGAAARARQVRCLVVDDNVDQARMLAVALEMERHEVQLAFDGREAVDVAATFHPEVIVLDIGLPRMNGYDAARAIRDLPGLRNVYIVALTGYGQSVDFERSRDSGMNEHLVKPVDLDVLLGVIAGRAGSPPGP